jgi:hypothetical protein
MGSLGTPLVTGVPATVSTASGLVAVAITCTLCCKIDTSASYVRRAGANSSAGTVAPESASPSRSTLSHASDTSGMFPSTTPVASASTHGGSSTNVTP